MESTEVINWRHPAVFKLARSLAVGTPLQTAQRCFEWVRDEIKHSYDYKLNPVTCSASEVLETGTGFCYAKSHLLAAMLRANRIPAGLCYQRLRLDGEGSPYCLHGLNGVYLPKFGWYRIDARGNKSTVNAQFVPPVEQLAFSLDHPGEASFPTIYADPLPEVVAALRTYPTYDQLADNLPDKQPE
ncbi:MAG: transglutaminase family protein [Anaerolineae bacterium]|nr:transglutaminase family protein [Anaerolineae bacterium]